MITAHEADQLVQDSKKEREREQREQERRKAEEQSKRIQHALAQYLPEEREKLDDQIKGACKREDRKVQVQFMRSPEWDAVADALIAELTAAKYAVNKRITSTTEEDDFNRWTEHHIVIEISW